METTGRARRDGAIVGLWAAAVVGVYAALHGLYRPENGDDAWTLSFLHNYRTRGIEYDLTFTGREDAGGQNGLELFGKVQDAVYSPLLERTGWSRASAHWLSTALMALACLGWGGIVANRTGSGGAGVFTALAMATLEPFFAAANQARPDALAFLLATLALWLFLRRRGVLAGFLAVLAFETHPMGAMGAFYVAAGVVSEWLAGGEARQSLKWRVADLLLGGLLGAGVYVGLHWAHWPKLAGLVSGANPTPPGAFLYEYFFRTKYLRHLPELALIATALVAFGARGAWRRHAFASGLLALTALSLLFLRRSNFHYAIYVYPAFLVVGVAVLALPNRLGLGAVALAALLLPQYGLAWKMNRDFDFDAYVGRLQASVPNDGAPILGNPNAWFAFREREFYAYEYTPAAFERLELKRFYLVENRAFAAEPRFQPLRRVIERDYERRPVTAYDAHRDRLAVHECRRRAP
jgi:hypothetical protein